MIPASRAPGTRRRHPRLSALFNAPCTCGASAWVLLRSRAAPDDEGRERVYGCPECGERLVTREVPAEPVMHPEAVYCRNTPTPDTPCPHCGRHNLRRCTHAAYDALIAHEYTCLHCRAKWRTAEAREGELRSVLPRTARRAARQA